MSTGRLMNKYDNLREKIQQAINEYSLENGSNTPDFILASYLSDCLQTFDKAVNAREQWFGRLFPTNEPVTPSKEI